MERRAFALVGSLLVLAALLVGGSHTAEARPRVQSTQVLCHAGGYTALARADGTGFRNQGECVSHAAQGGTLHQIDEGPAPAPSPTPPPRPGSILDATGGLSDESLVFNRPADWSTAEDCLAATQNWPYEAREFTLDADETVTISMRGLSSGGGTLDDPFVLVYAGTFDPAMPCVNLVRADDDSGVGFDAELTIDLTAGEYVVVATSRTAFDGGTYTLEVNKS